MPLHFSDHEMSSLRFNRNALLVVGDAVFTFDIISEVSLHLMCETWRAGSDYEERK